MYAIDINTDKGYLVTFVKNSTDMCHHKVPFESTCGKGLAKAMWDTKQIVL